MTLSLARLPTLGTAPNSEVLAKLNVNGPRYTSYPTADRFVQAFSSADLIGAHTLRNARSSATPLSIYIHIPFCSSLCYYCACNKIITKHQSKSEEYIEWLKRELQLHLEHLGENQTVSQIHLGGGSPTFCTDHELADLIGHLRSHFHVLEHAEISIEIDPRTVDRLRLVRLYAMGFNRVSFGIQDFDPAVQKAVHRLQSTDQIADLISAARSIGFHSINTDLIYGLPKQTEESFAKTLNLLSWLRPERIALYSYAHLPERFKAQRRIHTADLPCGVVRTELLALAIARLTEEGYVYIGMDHFALPSDTLAIAKQQGRLHRNFQGYTTQPEADLLSLGLSAIGQMGLSYSQNVKTMDEYVNLLKHEQLPIEKGLQLTRDDVLRRTIIMAIMCQGEVNFFDINEAHLIDFNAYFHAELIQLQTLATQGLVTLDKKHLSVTPLGWYAVRAVAMVFDRYIRTQQNTAKFSKII